MKVMNMDFGYNGDYTLDEIFAMNQHWSERSYFNMQIPRPTSALLYAAGCDLEYAWNSGTLFAEKGEIVYLPQESIYETRFIGAEKDKVSTILIEFISKLPNGEPFVFSLAPMIINGNTDGVSEYFTEMVKLFDAPLSSPARKKSVLYKVLSAIGYEEKTAGLFKVEFSSIAEGIMYMENDIKQEKSIAEIAELCHVSPSYFRKLFKKYSGVSPIKYQIQIKISRAKRLLQTNTMRISEISDALGFFDTAYFCKQFKKYAGISPKEYARKFIHIPHEQEINCDVATRISHA